MVRISQKIVPCVWLEKDADKAAEFYVSVFKNSRILRTSYYPKAAEEVSGKKKGSVLTVSFTLEGKEFIGTFPGLFNEEKRIVAYTPRLITPRSLHWNSW